MINSKVGKITIEYQTIHPTNDNVAQYVCHCDCGKYVILSFIELASSQNHSRGCVTPQKHNMSNTKLYNTWAVMKHRNKTKLCIDWFNPVKFIEWALTNGYSETNCNLTRKNRKLGFSPDNCYWTNRNTNRTGYRRGRKEAPDLYSDEFDKYFKYNVK